MMIVPPCSLGSSSGNGHQGVPFRIPSPSRRIARCLWPHQSRGPGRSNEKVTSLAHRLVGGLRLWRESTDPMVTGRLQGENPRFTTKQLIGMQMTK